MFTMFPSATLRTGSVLALALLIQACATGTPAKPEPHPRFTNPEWQRQQAELLAVYRQWESEFTGMDILSAGCPLSEEEVFQINSLLGAVFQDGQMTQFTLAELRENGLRHFESLQGVALKADCTAPRHPNDAIDTYVRYSGEGIGSMEYRLRSSGPTASRDGRITWQRAKPDSNRSSAILSDDQGFMSIQKEYDGNGGVASVTTMVQRKTGPDTDTTWSYQDSRLTSQFSSQGGQLHGESIHYLHTFAGTKVERSCYQNGRMAPESACGGRAAQQNDRFAASLIGGLAAAAAGHSMGMSEQASVNLAVSTARDVQAGSVSSSTMNAVNNPQAASQPVLQTYMDANRSTTTAAASPASSSGVMPSAPVAARPPASGQGGLLVGDHPVQPSSIRHVTHGGKPAQISSDVPADFYGVYDIPSYGGSAEVAKIARRITLNPDGTGSSHFYGAGGAPRPFNWGVLVADGRLEVSRMRTPTCFEDNSCVDIAPSVIVVMEYLQGDAGFIHIFESNGRLAMPGPYNMAIEKR